MIEWVVLFHVIAGAAWFGGQIYVEGLMASAARMKESSSILTVAQTAVRTSTRVFAVAATVLLITGLWIVIDETRGYRFEDMFVSIGFLVVLIGLGVSIFYLRPKGAELDASIASEGSSSDAARSVAKQISMVSHVMTLLVTVAFVLMVLDTHI